MTHQIQVILLKRYIFAYIPIYCHILKKNILLFFFLTKDIFYNSELLLLFYLFLACHLKCNFFLSMKEMNISSLDYAYNNL